MIFFFHIILKGFSRISSSVSRVLSMNLQGMLQYTLMEATQTSLHILHTICIIDKTLVTCVTLGHTSSTNPPNYSHLQQSNRNSTVRVPWRIKLVTCWKACSHWTFHFPTVLFSLQWPLFKVRLNVKLRACLYGRCQWRVFFLNVGFRHVSSPDNFCKYDGSLLCSPCHSSLFLNSSFLFNCPSSILCRLRNSFPVPVLQRDQRRFRPLSDLISAATLVWPEFTFTVYWFNPDWNIKYKNWIILFFIFNTL